jgi:CubicO group peptidase (beta-lactamase class C family)
MSNDILEILNRYHSESDFSGVCLVRQGDRDIVHQAFGFAHRGFTIPNDVTTRFDIASVTKIFTAAAIMQLVDQGKLALDTRVMPFLEIEGTPVSDNVTVFHCLTHTSGIADDADEEAGEEYELLFVDKPNYSIRETKDFLPQCTEKQPNFRPGEGVRYNNCAFVLLGLVIEKVTGMPYRDYVRRHIFAPAGMETADFCAMDGVCPNLAEHYKQLEGLAGEKAWRKNIYSYPPIGSPDGGATVTANDLAQFIRAIQTHQLMSESASRELLSPQVVREEDPELGSLWNGFGFEFELDRDGVVIAFGKDGVNAGVASICMHYPASDTTIVILANQDCNVWEMLDEIVKVIG